MTEHKLVTVTNNWQPTLDMENVVSVFLGSEDDRYLLKKSEISASQTNELPLTNPTECGNDNCVLEFVCSPGTAMSEICVHSDVSMMEVFENVEGYLFSERCEEASADSLVSCSLKFERPRTHISVKCLGQVNNIKLNSILLRVESVPVPVGCQGSLNIPKLRSIIADLNPETSERASSILDNIETYQKNHQNPISDMSNIAQILSSVGNKNVGINNNEMYSALQGICGHVTNLRPGPGGTNLNPAANVDTLVDERISQAEARILETVDDRLERMENRLASKLDALLSTLGTVQLSDTKPE